jgi:N-acetylglucosamine malate deacetylase 1
MGAFIHPERCSYGWIKENKGREYRRWGPATWWCRTIFQATNSLYTIMKMLRGLIVGAYRRMVPTGMKNTLRLWTMFESADRAGQVIEDFSQGPVVVLAPHMDDEAIGPGGTVAMHARAGAKVMILLLTDGAMGDPDIGAGDPSPDEIARRRRALVELRKEESRRAAQILGASEIEFCDAPDGALAETPELVAKVAAVLNDRRPAVVYLPAVTDIHRDHWSANRVLRSALDQLPEALSKNMIIRGYEIWGTLPANRIADITPVVKIKEQAIAAFPSQLKSKDFTSAALGLNRYRSLMFSPVDGYAEAFLETTVSEYKQLFEAIVIRGNGKRAFDPRMVEKHPEHG